VLRVILALITLFYIYDKNNCSIEGPTDLAMSENVGKRFEALGWVVLDIDGSDHGQIMGALNIASRTKVSQCSLSLTPLSVKVLIKKRVNAPPTASR